MSSAELPELEILRRDLDKEVSGKKIKAVDVPGKKSIARAGTPKALATRLTGVKIERVTRKGTWISLALDSGDVMLVALGAKSRLRRARSASTWSTSPSRGRSSARWCCDARAS